MVLAEPVTLYLPKELRKIVVRKVVNEYANGSKEEKYVNEDILKDLNALKKYFSRVDIEHIWITEEVGKPSVEKTKVTFYFPNISYELISKDYNEKSKTLNIDLKHFIGAVIL
jgi:adenosyl cobinamide kinase/adenosyl cobinamide phosphate guanylyltransferase